MAQIKRTPGLPFIEIKTGIDPEFSLRRHSHEELSVGFVENGSSLISQFNDPCDPFTKAFKGHMT